MTGMTGPVRKKDVTEPWHLFFCRYTMQAAPCLPHAGDFEETVFYYKFARQF